MKNKKVLSLCECAIMVALATVLSIIKLLALPYGGSITAFSAVPMVIISYRRGVKWGLISGLAYSIIQLILDASVLSYATSFVAGIAIVCLDYLVAFTFLGFSGIFKNISKNHAFNAVCGTLMVCAIRYLCHVISGCTVWAGVSIPSTDGLFYSLSYNATYMIPETIINVAAVFVLFSSIDFTAERLRRADKKGKSLASTALTSAGLLSIVIAVIIDTVSVFGALQNPDTGELDITLISNVNAVFLGTVTAIGLVMGVMCFIIALITAKKALKSK